VDKKWEMSADEVCEMFGNMVSYVFGRQYRCLPLDEIEAVYKQGMKVGETQAIQGILTASAEAVEKIRGTTVTVTEDLPFIDDSADVSESEKPKNKAQIINLFNEGLNEGGKNES
jgi:hypothetical protein